LLEPRSRKKGKKRREEGHYPTKKKKKKGGAQGGPEPIGSEGGDKRREKIKTCLLMKKKDEGEVARGDHPVRTKVDKRFLTPSPMEKRAKEGPHAFLKKKEIPLKG